VRRAHPELRHGQQQHERRRRICDKRAAAANRPPWTSGRCSLSSCRAIGATDFQLLIDDVVFVR
jgi:hypothetical protein